MPSITQLEYLLAVHRYKHFGEAAQACFISQPTLSAQIKKAEEELGLVLFDRRAKPIATTPKGLRVIELAQHVITAHERLLDLAKGQFEELSGELVLGVIPTLAPYITHLFLGTFAKRYPKVRLTIVERPTEGIIADLRNLSMDLGLLATPLAEPTISERVLFYDPLYIYAAPNDPLLDAAEISPEMLDPDCMWLLQDGHCLRHQALSLCELGESCALSNIRFEAGSLETLRHIIDESTGYTIVPESFARLLPLENRLQQVRPMSEPVPTREVGLVHLKTSWKVELIDALAESIVENLPRSLRETPEQFALLSPI